MENNKQTKKRRLPKGFILSLSIIAGVLVFDSVAFIGVLGFSKYGNNKSIREQQNIPYILGKGCIAAYDYSDEELKKAVEKDFLYSTDKDKFKSLVVEKRNKNLQRLNEHESESSLTSNKIIKENPRKGKCFEVYNRILDIL